MGKHEKSKENCMGEKKKNLYTVNILYKFCIHRFKPYIKNYKTT